MLITLVYLLRLVVVLSSCFPTFFRILELQNLSIDQGWIFVDGIGARQKKNSVLKHVSVHLISPPPFCVFLRECVFVCTCSCLWVGFCAFDSMRACPCLMKLLRFWWCQGDVVVPFFLLGERCLKSHLHFTVEDARNQLRAERESQCASVP